MPQPPRSGDAVLELVRKSELADDDVLNAFRLHSGPTPVSANDTASQLVRAGVLTPFQARSLLQGKHRGFRLGPYRILDHIGAGGMGQVFLAEHTRMHRLAALKVLTPRLALEPSMLERFYCEARAVAALDHPNIVRAYDTGYENGTHYLALEYINGGSLADRLCSAGGRLTTKEACDFVSQAAEGLQHAHDKGVAHRDVKPGNLLVDGSGVVKILDMGLAKFFEEPHGWSSLHLADVMGTTDYASPEQLSDCPASDHRSDIYSLGATLYHLVTGRPPFEGSTTAKLVAHHLSAVPPAHSVCADVPPELSVVIEKMMAKNPSDRYQSANEVSAALRPFVADRVKSWREDARNQTEAAVNRSSAVTSSSCHMNWFAIGFVGTLLASGTLLIAALLLRNPTSEAATTPATQSSPSSQPCYEE